MFCSGFGKSLEVELFPEIPQDRGLAGSGEAVKNVSLVTFRRFQVLYEFIDECLATLKQMFGRDLHLIPGNVVGGECSTRSYFEGELFFTAIQLSARKNRHYL